MNPTSLEEAIQFDIAFVDALCDRAIEEEAHPKVQRRLLARRNELVRALGKTWHTRPVETVGAPGAARRPVLSPSDTEHP